MAQCSTCIGLLLLLIGQISAEPESEPARRNSITATCKDQNTLSNRMDTVEKWVEDTVQKLEEEMADLLDAIEGPELSLLLNSNNAGPAVHILDESSPEP